eukprot:6479678-Amphidinium_carterae.1
MRDSSEHACRLEAGRDLEKPLRQAKTHRDGLTLVRSFSMEKPPLLGPGKCAKLPEKLANMHLWLCAPERVRDVTREERLAHDHVTQDLLEAARELRVEGTGYQDLSEVRSIEPATSARLARPDDEVEDTQELPPAHAEEPSVQHDTIDDRQPEELTLKIKRYRITFKITALCGVACLVLQTDEAEWCFLTGEKHQAMTKAEGFKDPDLGEFEVSSPTLSRDAMPFVLLTVASYKWKLVVADIKGAFMTSRPLQRECGDIYASLPKLWMHRELANPLQLVLMKVAWYRLEDGPRELYESLSSEAMHLGYFVREPTVETLLEANRIVREAKSNCVTLKIPSISMDRIRLVCTADSAWGNAPDLSSHMGCVMLATDETLDTGHVAPAAPLVWKSNKQKRKTPSTLAAEAQPTGEGVGVLGWCEVFLEACVQEDFELQHWQSAVSCRPSLVLTNCKSVFDSLSQLWSTGVADKRTTIDLAIIREALSKDVSKCRWMDTQFQLVDSLTKKSASPDYLRQVLREGVYSVVEECQELERRSRDRNGHSNSQ